MRSLITRLFCAHRATRSADRCRPAVELLESRLQPTVSLGSAASYGVLALANTSITNTNASISGDVGVSSGGSMANQPSSSVTGTVHVVAPGQYAGKGKLNGVVIVDSSLLSQNDADALGAAAQAAALAPTQTLGTVSSPTTVVGNGGTNVVKVNGDLKDSLTLSGSASDIFIVNVSGTLSLGNKATLGLAGGITADHVLYNFTGSSGSITVKSNNVVNGTLLAPKYSVSMDGTVNGAIIGGKSITMTANAQVTAKPYAPPVANFNVSLSGHVNGDFGPVAGASVQLSWVDRSGVTHAQNTTTDGSGGYCFAGLTPDTYMISVVGGPMFNAAGASVGTVNGSCNGCYDCNQSLSQISAICLSDGDAGINYDFLETSSNS